MILKYKREHFFDLYNFLKENKNLDFYVVENNIRKFIDDDKDLLLLLRSAKDVFVCEEDSEIRGVILLWELVGNNISRQYVKMNAIDNSIADKLLSVFLWNCNTDLFVKIRRGSKFLNTFRNKGFKFLENRGSELLLRRYKNSLRIESNNGSFNKQSQNENQTADK